MSDERAICSGGEQRRTPRRFAITGNRDRLRRYSVLVDGAEIGRVKRGESVTTDVSPGVHTLTIQIDGTKSEASFEVSGSDEVHFNLQPGGRTRDGARDLVSGAPWVSITRADEP